MDKSAGKKKDPIQKKEKGKEDGNPKKRELSAEELDKVSGGGMPQPKHHAQKP